MRPTTYLIFTNVYDEYAFTIISIQITNKTTIIIDLKVDEKRDQLPNNRTGRELQLLQHTFASYVG